MTTIRELRAAAPMPGGASRLHAFPGEIRSKLVTRDGRQYFEVEGYATVFNRAYRMFDQFGEYTESVNEIALDRSLANGPDVSFLVNHKGLTMARSIPGPNGREPSLTLKRDSTGLNAFAYLNADRQDVRDLMSAIDDKIVTEMSFAFMLNQGTWDDDYGHYDITEADINRGDVSAVNYGANPYTSIEARSADIIADLAKLGAPAARKAMAELAKREDVASEWEAISRRLGEEKTRQATGRQPRPAPEETSGEKPERTGSSVALKRIEWLPPAR